VDLAVGRGDLGFARVDGATAVVRCRARSPLKVLVPRHRGPSAWAFLATFGGGLLAGDRVELDVDVGPGATALLANQAETKVYRSPSGAEAVQVVRAHVGRGGTLVVLPDPVSPFAGARFAQEQRYTLDEGGSLLLLDALVAGRTARGERWAFHDYRSRVEVSAGGALVVGDAVSLASRGERPVASQMGRFEALALVVCVGPAFAGSAAALLDGLGQAPVQAAAPLIAAASPFSGGVLLRAAARSAEHLARFLRDSLSFVAGPLGDDPFQRRW
jgi:urease accessory protein